jgi:hypothetical protein
MLVESFFEGFLFFEEGFFLGKLEMPEMFSLFNFNENTVLIAGEYSSCFSL